MNLLELIKISVQNNVAIDKYCTNSELESVHFYSKNEHLEIDIKAVNKDVLNLCYEGVGLGIGGIAGVSKIIAFAIDPEGAKSITWYEDKVIDDSLIQIFKESTKNFDAMQVRRFLEKDVIKQDKLKVKYPKLLAVINNYINANSFDLLKNDFTLTDRIESFKIEKDQKGNIDIMSDTESKKIEISIMDLCKEKNGFNHNMLMSLSIIHDLVHVASYAKKYITYEMNNLLQIYIKENMQ